MNNKIWEAVEVEDKKYGSIGYYYAELATTETVQSIMIKAQANTTELGYWRDIATDLATLVDSLTSERDALREAYKAAKEWAAAFRADIGAAADVYQRCLTALEMIADAHTTDEFARRCARAALKEGNKVCLTCGELVPQGCCTCGPRQRLEVKHV